MIVVTTEDGFASRFSHDHEMFKAQVFLDFFVLRWRDLGFGAAFD
jgi:hypothetical protein